MSIYDKWSVLPEVEHLAKEMIMKLIKQAKWDKRVAYYLPIIVKNYNKTAKSGDKIKL